MARIDASYTVLRDKALPGQIADTSLYNVDGACAADVVVPVGKFVFALAPSATDNPEGLYKRVTPINSGALKIVGVAVISQAHAPNWQYDEGSAVNVLTHGRVWVEVPVATTLAQVAFDTAVVVNATGDVTLAAAAAGDTTTAHRFTGELVAHKLDATKRLAKIQLVQSGASVIA